MNVAAGVQRRRQRCLSHGRPTGRSRRASSTCTQRARSARQPRRRRPYAKIALIRFGCSTASCRSARLSQRLRGTRWLPSRLNSETKPGWASICATWHAPPDVTSGRDRRASVASRGESDAAGDAIDDLIAAVLLPSAVAISPLMIASPGRTGTSERRRRRSGRRRSVRIRRRSPRPPRTRIGGRPVRTCSRLANVLRRCAGERLLEEPRRHQRMIDRPEPLNRQRPQAPAHAVADHQRARQHRRRDGHADGHREVGPAEVDEVAEDEAELASRA